MLLIGQQLARMHTASIIHGDLTTSNMILRRCEPDVLLPSTMVEPSMSSREPPAEIVRPSYDSIMHTLTSKKSRFLSTLASHPRPPSRKTKQ